nr:unnamed protein product [Callosobruchus chinensis]
MTLKKVTAQAKRRREESSRSVYAKEVCNVIVAQIKDRFSFRGHLQAEELFVTESFEEFSKDFPANVLDAVVRSLPFFVSVSFENRNWRSFTLDRTSDT